jgi:hypothetical protein
MDLSRGAAAVGADDEGSGEAAAVRRLTIDPGALSELTSGGYLICSARVCYYYLARREGIEMYLLVSRTYIRFASAGFAFGMNDSPPRTNTRDPYDAIACPDRADGPGPMFLNVNHRCAIVYII